MADKAAAEPRDSWRAWRAGRGWGIVLPLVAAVPVVRAVARAVRVGWVPIADEGVIALRAYDVLTARTPALGQMSLASGTTGVPTRSPGPMGYWVLAPAAQVGPLWLVAAAAGVVAVAALVATVHLAGRRGGLPLAAAVTAGLVLSARAVDPVNHAVGWNPSIGLAPMALLVLLAWSVGVGERRCFPATVLVASFLGQVHVTFLLPSVAAVAAAVASGWGPEVVGRVRRWRAGRGIDTPFPPLRPLVLGVGLGMVLWAGPLLQQVLRPPGNLVLVARSAGGETHGLRFGAGVVAWSVGLPPAGARGNAVGLEAFVRLVPRWPSLQVVTGAAVAVGLVALAGWGIRLRRRDVAVPPLVVLAVLGAGAATLQATPTDARGISVIYTSWWLIPVGVLAWIVLVATVLRAAPSVAAPLRRRAARPTVGVLATVVVVGLTLAVAVGTPVRDREDHLYAVADAAGDAVVARVRPGERYLVDALGPLGLQLSPGLAYRIRRAGGHPVLIGGDGLSAGPEYVPGGAWCDAVVGVVGLRLGAPVVVPPGAEVLLVADVPEGPAVDDRRFVVTWSVDAGGPSC